MDHRFFWTSASLRVDCLFSSVQKCSFSISAAALQQCPGQFWFQWRDSNKDWRRIIKLSLSSVSSFAVCHVLTLMQLPLKHIVGVILQKGCTVAVQQWLLRIGIVITCALLISTLSAAIVHTLTPVFTHFSIPQKQAPIVIQICGGGTFCSSSAMIENRCVKTADTTSGSYEEEFSNIGKWSQGSYLETDLGSFCRKYCAYIATSVVKLFQFETISLELTASTICAS